MNIFSILKQQKPVLCPNVLLTSVCNQSCPYCFAQDEMKRSEVKEMSINDFKKLTSWLIKNNIKTLRLMGGEPTIHSKFSEIMNLAVSNFDNISIFSNGLIPPKSQEIIWKNIDKLDFVFNIDTYAFQKDKAKRREIITLINNLVTKAKVNAGFTLSDLHKDYTKLYSDFPNSLMSQMNIRFGLAKTLKGEKSIFSKKDYPKIGKKITELIRYFKNMGVKDIFLDCGLQKEMFSKDDLNYLIKNSHIHGWGCQGKWSSFDIAPDLTTFSCFPVSREKRKNLNSMIKDRNSQTSFREKETEWGCI